MTHVLDSDIGITVTWLPPEERSHPKDAYQICQYGGKCWVATSRQVLAFLDDLYTLLEEHDEQ
jgi:hypothetical protein